MDFVPQIRNKNCRRLFRTVACDDQWEIKLNKSDSISLCRTENLNNARFKSSSYALNNVLYN